MIKTIIFDFDGVIVESVNVKTEAFAEMYHPYGKEVVNRVIKHHLANGGISRYEKFKLYHKEFLGIDLSQEDIMKMATRFSSLVLDKVVQAPYVPGAERFLKENNKKYLMFVSSGTPELEIKEICSRRKIKGYFKGIFGSPETKSSHAKHILEKWNLKGEETAFIGDAPSDLEAAIDNGLHFIERRNQDDSPLITESLHIKNFVLLEKIINENFGQ